jgi:hypothetical protein
MERQIKTEPSDKKFSFACHEMSAEPSWRTRRAHDPVAQARQIISSRRRITAFLQAAFVLVLQLILVAAVLGMILLAVTNSK